MKYIVILCSLMCTGLISHPLYTHYTPVIHETNRYVRKPIIVIHMGIASPHISFPSTFLENAEKYTYIECDNRKSKIHIYSWAELKGDTIIVLRIEVTLRTTLYAVKYTSRKNSITTVDYYIQKPNSNGTPSPLFFVPEEKWDQHLLGGAYNFRKKLYNEINDCTE